MIIQQIRLLFAPAVTNYHNFGGGWYTSQSRSRGFSSRGSWPEVLLPSNIENLGPKYNYIGANFLALDGILYHKQSRLVLKNVWQHSIPGTSLYGNLLIGICRWLKLTPRQWIYYPRSWNHESKRWCFGRLSHVTPLKYSNCSFFWV